MKTWKHLYPDLCSFKNLYEAARKAQRGKRCRPDVFAFHARLEENLLALQEELTTRRWQPGPYREFYVQEAKRRLICAAPYRDRVVHHALCNIIEPLFENVFIYDSYACRKGKGTHAAADRYTAFSRQARYVLKCDIARYFPSICHEALYGQLSRRIADGDVLWLCERVLRSYGDEGLLWPSGAGIPIGNQTSQFFANVYLNDFDHWMKEAMQCRWYIRYVDDFVILDDDKRFLGSLIPRIEERLEAIGARLHPRKRTIFPVTEGCDFMGYRIWPDHRRLRPRNGYRFQRKLKKLARGYRAGTISREDARASIMSWAGHAGHADTWGLRRALYAGVSFSGGPAGKDVSCVAGRLLEQQQQEPPLGKPQQEQPRQQEQQQRVPCGGFSGVAQDSRTRVSVFATANAESGVLQDATRSPRGRCGRLQAGSRAMRMRMDK